MVDVLFPGKNSHYFEAAVVVVVWNDFFSCSDF